MSSPYSQSFPNASISINEPSINKLSISSSSSSSSINPLPVKFIDSVTYSISMTDFNSLLFLNIPIGSGMTIKLPSLTYVKAGSSLFFYVNQNPNTHSLTILASTQDGHNVISTSLNNSYTDGNHVGVTYLTPFVGYKVEVVCNGEIFEIITIQTVNPLNSDNLNMNGHNITNTGSITASSYKMSNDTDISSIYLSQAGGQLTGNITLDPLQTNTLTIGSDDARLANIYTRLIDVTYPNGIPSDMRLKEKIIYLDENTCYDFIQDLKPCRYAYKSDPDTLHYGFLAQEVKQALDDNAIHDKVIIQNATPDENAMMRLIYDEFIPPMVSTIQILQKENEETKRMLNHCFENLDLLNEKLSELLLTMK